MVVENKSLDIDTWPILVARLTDPGDISGLENDLALVEDLFIAKKESYVTIIDARNGERPSPAQRYLQTEFRRKHEDHIKQYSRGTAIVVNSEILKAVARAMFWIKAPDNVTKMFTDMDEAIEWAQLRLEI